MEASWSVPIAQARAAALVAGRRARFNELVTVARSDGSYALKAFSGDRGGQLRAAATLGLEGVCGCGQCGLCRSVRRAPGGCSCQQSCCPAQQPTLDEALGKNKKLKVGMGSPWKLFLATDLIDTHSHLFSASWVDWMETLLRESFRHDVVDTATEERIGWLLGFQDLGISRMAISGMYDPAVYQKEGWINQSLNRPTVDDVTAHAWIRSPDYFIPFVRDFELDPSNVDAPAYVQSWLEAGFRGVGELFVHGHGFDYVGDLDFLAKICRVAARYDAPVLVHWEIGQVDDRKFVTSADENFEQLQELLHMVRTGPGSGENPPLKLILAHCGAGPGAKLMLERNGLLESYERKLDILLDNPNVYFDIAGTVGVGGSDFWAIDYERPERSQPTEVGKSILSRIQAKPDQFMVGFDAETRFFSGHQIGLHSVEEYRASVNHYLDYLRYEGTLGIFALNKVQSENARKLWPRMTRP